MFILIRSVIEKFDLKNRVSYLCEVAGVSRSGYYNYFSEKSQKRRNKKEATDEKVKEIILKAFHFKRRKKGARQIKMTLAGQFSIVYNLKQIRRIMKKYGIICPIRKANPYRRMMKATQEHRVVPNILNREFGQYIPGKVLLTDITYLFYGKGQKAVKKLGLRQSMSRRGNCWDNAPQESFFGHFKDEACIKECTTLDELKREIKQYITYYNQYRYQWNFKKMTPVQYRGHLLKAA